MIAHLPITGGWRDLVLSEWFYQEDLIPISLNKILCCLYFSTPFTRQEACIFAIPGLLCLSVYSTVGIFYYDYWDWPRLFFYLLRGFSEWLFIIGVYEAAGHQAPARAGEAERAGHALLPHPPADPGAHSRGLLLGATPQ